MRTIFSALGYSITTDGTGLTDDECGQVSFETRLIDLNHDHIPEVVVISGNPCTSGNTGGSINLFIKAPDGKYHGHLGFPANDFVELKTSNKGFPDLLFGGPGLCHGVWHWSGNKYEYKCNWEDTPGACGAKGVKNLCRER